MTKTADQILDTAAGIIEVAGHVRGYWHLRPGTYNSLKGGYCMLGAMRKVADVGLIQGEEYANLVCPEYLEAKKALYRQLRKYTKTVPEEPAEDIIFYNDEKLPGGAEEAVTLLKKAAKKARRSRAT